MDLYLLRHGEAGDKDQWEGTDNLRPLTEEGKAMMKQQALTFAEWKLPIDTLVTSPLVRAKQTADIVAKILNLKVIENDALGSGKFGLTELSQIFEKYQKSEHLMLVGHEPDFTHVLSELIGGGEH